MLYKGALFLLFENAPGIEVLSLMAVLLLPRLQSAPSIRKHAFFFHNYDLIFFC